MFTLVNTTFANWILREIDSRGWNQSELARRSGLSPTAVSDVLSGRRNPGIVFCDGVAQAFKIPSAEVYKIAGLLPVDELSDPSLSKIQHLFNSLQDEGNKQKALEFLQFLSDLEYKNGRKGKTVGQGK